jgi:hypothetical protein
VPLYVLNPAGIEQRLTQYLLSTLVQKTGLATQLSLKIRAVSKKVKETLVSQQATSAYTIQKETKSTKSLGYHPTRQKSKDTCGITYL